MRLGSVGGVPIGVHWSALVVIGLIVVMLGGAVLPVAAGGLNPVVYWAVAVATALLFFVSLLAHELAHSLVARRRGVRAKSVTLWLLGGLTELEGEARTPRAELEIAIVGPLMSLAFSAAAFIVLLTVPGPPAVLLALSWLAFMNLVLAVFNLLPGSPLDGGRVLHSALWRHYHDRARADRMTARAGQTLGAMLIGIGFVQMLYWSPSGGIWTIVIGWFLAAAARGELMTRTTRDGLAGLRVRDVMTTDPDLASVWLDVEQFVTSVAVRSRQTVFPVVDFGGAPAGYVSLDSLDAVAPSRRRSTRIQAVARPLPPERILPPDAEGVHLLDHPPTGELVALVVEGERIVGMVTTADLSRIVRLAALRRVVTGLPVR
ncbi:site-2 protease family protein [Planotetraspora sp. GP83]|uniref:site-2 protease family protein n=1 Tax=Planotetraspora sp. GP83 TaxID=3156264 RepID=UPI003517DAE0